MPVVNDMKQDIRCVIAVGQVADLVDDEQLRSDKASERIAQLTGAAGGGQFVDERGGRDEECIEAILDRTVRDRDGQMRLSASRLAREAYRRSFGHKIGRECGAEQLQPHGRLIREVEVVKGLEKRKACMRGSDAPRASIRQQ